MKMMNPFSRPLMGIALLISCVMLPFPLAAQDRGTSEPEPTDAVTQPDIAASETDAGNPYAGLRDPFWPVGYVPDAPKEKGPEKKPSEDPKWDEATKMLDVKGVMNAGGGTYVAMINNQVVNEGDIVSAKMGSLLYRWKVRSITKTGARFEPLDATR